MTYGFYISNFCRNAGEIIESKVDCRVWRVPWELWKPAQVLLAKIYVVLVAQTHKLLSKRLVICAPSAQHANTEHRQAILPGVSLVDAKSWHTLYALALKILVGRTHVRNIIDCPDSLKHCLTWYRTMFIVFVRRLWHLKLVVWFIKLVRGFSKIFLGLNRSDALQTSHLQIWAQQIWIDRWKSPHRL